MSKVTYVIIFMIIVTFYLFLPF